MRGRIKRSVLNSRTESKKSKIKMNWMEEWEKTRLGRMEWEEWSGKNRVKRREYNEHSVKERVGSIELDKRVGRIAWKE